MSLLLDFVNIPTLLSVHVALRGPDTKQLLWLRFGESYLLRLCKVCITIANENLKFSIG